MNKSGFTLIEAIIALLVIGVSGVALFKTQGELFLSSSNIHAHLDRIILMKNYLIKAEQNNWFKKKQNKSEKLTNPEVDLTLEISDPESANLKSLKNLVQAKVSAKWFGARGDVSHSLIYFKYNLL